VLRAETGCAIIPLHHENSRPRNGAGADAADMDFMRGDSRLRGFPQAVLRVLEHRGTGCVRFAKVSCAASPSPLYFAQDEAGVPHVTQEPAEAQKDKGKASRERIARFVLDAGRPVSRSEVEAAVSLGRSATTKHLNALIQAGRIDSYGDNKDTCYVPPTGDAGWGAPVGGNGHAR
jgi:hypothetical protein